MHTLLQKTSWRFAVAALALVAFVLAAPSASATVHVVDVNGTGFTDVQSAINAAAPGDVVLIRPGNYVNTLTSVGIVTTVGKSLSLVGESDAQGNPPLLGVVRVADLASDERVVVRNLRLWAVAPLLLPTFESDGAEVCDSAGVVLLEDCDIRGTSGVPTGLTIPDPAKGGLAVMSSDSVIVSNCTLVGGLGGEGLAFSPAGEGGDGLIVTDSNVTLYHTAIVGGPGGSDTFGNGGAHGGRGAVVSGSDVRLFGVDVTGGAGSDGCPPAMAGDCAGGDGLVVTGPALLRSVGSSWAGGPGGELTDASSAPAGTDLVNAGGTLIEWADQPPRITGPPVLREGEAGVLSLAGEPGHLLRIYLAFNFLYAPLGGKKGVFVPAPPSVGPILLGTVPPSGQLDLPLTGPDLLGLDGLMTTWQIYTREGAGGGLIMSNPHELLLGAAGL